MEAQLCIRTTTGSWFVISQIFTIIRTHNVRSFTHNSLRLFFFKNTREAFYWPYHTLGAILAPFLYCRWHVSLRNLYAAVNIHIAMMDIAHCSHWCGRKQDYDHRSIIVVTTISLMLSGFLSSSPLNLYKMLPLFILHFTQPTIVGWIPPVQCRIARCLDIPLLLSVIRFVVLLALETHFLTIRQHQFSWLSLIILRPISAVVVQPETIDERPLSRRSIEPHLGLL